MSKLGIGFLPAAHQGKVIIHARHHAGAAVELRLRCLERHGYRPLPLPGLCYRIRDSVFRLLDQRMLKRHGDAITEAEIRRAHIQDISFVASRFYANCLS